MPGVPFLQVLLLLGVARLAGGVLNCKVEQGVGYRGPNLAITIPGSGVPGCAIRANAQECCTLCASYWPQCVSWQYIKDGTDQNGYPGLSFYCCLKGTLRPDPESTTNCCDSGYQNPRCHLSSQCDVELTGQGLSAGNSMVILEPGLECGSNESQAQDWIGFTNPTTVETQAPFKEYAFGQALTGAVGDFRLCYKETAGNASDHVSPVGDFTMRGPQSGQVHSCTLGLECQVVLAGAEFREDPARYKLLIVRKDTSANPCPTGGTFTGELASFENLQNPDNVEDDANDNVFRLGTPKSGSTTLEYGLCWANDPSTNAEYTVHVGTFTVGGPTIGTPTCTMGVACQIQLLGRDFASTNAVIIGVGPIGAVCGSFFTPPAYFGQGFDNPRTMIAPAPFATYTFGVPLLAPFNTPGNGYRLCWTHEPTVAPTNPYDVRNYPIDAGAFTIHGPVVGNQQCTYTLDCTLTLTGSGLADAIPSYGVLLVFSDETCGELDALSPNISGTTWSNPASATGSTSIQFGIATVGVASDYKACWGSQPATAADYTITLGTFAMGGPQAGSAVQCTKGVACDILLTGSGFAETNRVLVINDDRCGKTSPQLADFNPMSVEKLANQDGIYNKYQMGFPNSGTANQGYLLCWAADPSSHAQFTYEVGQFEMIGANTAPRSCTIGLACTMTLSGFSLQSSNKIALLASGSCGDNQPGLVLFAGMLNRKAVDAATPYSTYSLGTPVAGTPGASNKVCWAHDPGILGLNQYRVDVGVLTMNGPVQVAQTCTMSMDCVLQLTGTGLAATNEILIIESTSGCGATSPTVASFTGIQNPKQVEATVFGRFVLGIPSAGEPGTDYLICWAHSPTSYAEYRVTLGTFTMVGPDTLPIVYCTFGLDCVATITGHGLAATNKIMVAALTDSCGQATLSLPAFAGFTNPAPIATSLLNFPMGIPTAGVPGDYTICWAHHGDDHGDYHVNVAMLRMSGPTPADKQCTFAEPCKIAVAGVRLAHTSKVLIIERNKPCGDPDSVVASWPGVTNPAGTDLLAAPAVPGYTLADGDTYDGGLGTGGTPGALYRLCWAFDPPGAEGAQAYKVPVGLFDMNGPNQGLSIACTLGQACNMALTGWGLAASNKVQIVAGTGACGSNTLVPAVLQGIDNPRAVTDDNYDNSYALGLVTVGGSYGACRVANPAETCIGSHYKLCWAHGVHQPAADQFNFVVEIGTFAMSGPFVTYASECLLGAVCAFRIYGSEFQATNRVLVVEERGACGDVNPPIAEVAGFTNPQKVAEVSADGKHATFRLGRSAGGRVASYRLCWGFDPLVPLHYNIEVGPFYLKAVPGNCEMTDGMTATCTGTS